MVLSPVAAVAGVAEGLGWISAGLLATLTGGAFGISPDSIAQLQASTGLQLPEGHRSYAAYALGPAPTREAECTAD